MKSHEFFEEFFKVLEEDIKTLGGKITPDQNTRLPIDEEDDENYEDPIGEGEGDWSEVDD